MFCSQASENAEKLELRKTQNRSSFSPFSYRTIYLLLVMMLSTNMESHESRYVFEFINSQIQGTIRYSKRVAPEHNRPFECDATKTMKTTTPSEIDSSSCQLICVNVSLPFCQQKNKKKNVSRKTKTK